MILSSNLFQHFDAALAWHPNVQHQDVGVKFLNLPERLDPVLRRSADHQPLYPREQDPQLFSDQCRIVCNNYLQLPFPLLRKIPHCHGSV